MGLGAAGAAATGVDATVATGACTGSPLAAGGACGAGGAPNDMIGAVIAWAGCIGWRGARALVPCIDFGGSFHPRSVLWSACCNGSIVIRACRDPHVIPAGSGASPSGGGPDCCKGCPIIVCGGAAGVIMDTCGSCEPIPMGGGGCMVGGADWYEGWYCDAVGGAAAAYMDGGGMDGVNATGGAGG